MINLTVRVDDETLKRARIQALEEGTSVNALLRVFLEEYEASSGSGGRSWTRDELYERS